MGCEKQRAFGFLCVLGGVLIQICYGYFYTIGNMAPYMVDYMNYHNISVQSTSVVWLTSVALSMEAVAMPIGGVLATKFGFRLVVFLSCLIQSGSIALTYFTIKTGFIAVILTYGAMNGFGFGFGYSVIISTAAMWFPHSRGLVVGLIVGGFGAGSLIFTPIQTAYINPGNIPVDNSTNTFTDPELLNRVPKAFLVLAVTIASVQMVGLMMMRERPKDDLAKDIQPDKAETAENTELEHLNKQEVNISGHGDNNLGAEVTEVRLDDNDSLAKWHDKPTPGKDQMQVCDIPPKHAIRSLDFYLLWFVVCFAVVPITNVSSLYKVAGIKYIRDDLFLAGVAMAASLCNSGGRVIWGIICDHLSFKLPMCLMCIVWTIALFTFPHISVFTGITAKVVYLIWVSVLFLCQCGLFVFAPTATEVLFGPIHLAINYGLIYNAFIAGSMFASVMNMVRITESREDQAFMLSGLVCILALIILLFMADRKTPKRCRFINYPYKLRRYICGTRCGGSDLSTGKESHMDAVKA